VSGLPSHQLKKRKRDLRREVLARRDALPTLELRAKSDAIAERLLALPEFAGERTVLAFWSFGSEVDTAPILSALAARGHRVALPRIEGGDLVAVSYRPGDPVTETSFGAREPAAGEVLREDEIDVVITPGVAFDHRGFRVGYGGGYYDRFLRRARLDAFRVGIGFALQVVDAVPHGGTDVPVDAVVTEDEVLRCPRA
jgi:5-formyltetrahydrofolate cyclo-ligase